MTENKKMFYAQNIMGGYDNPYIPEGNWGFNDWVFVVKLIPTHFYNKAGLIICGGRFTAYRQPSGSNVITFGLVILNPDFSVYKNFAPTAFESNKSYSVRSITIVNNYFYVGGAFSVWINSNDVQTPSQRLIKFNIDGSIAKSFYPGIDNLTYGQIPTVNYISYDGNRYLHIGGIFWKFANTSKGGYAIIDTTDDTLINTDIPSIGQSDYPGITLTSCIYDGVREYIILIHVYDGEGNIRLIKKELSNGVYTFTVKQLIQYNNVINRISDTPSKGPNKCIYILSNATGYRDMTNNPTTRVNIDKGISKITVVNDKVVINASFTGKLENYTTWQSDCLYTQDDGKIIISSGHIKYNNEALHPNTSDNGQHLVWRIHFNGLKDNTFTPMSRIGGTFQNIMGITAITTKRAIGVGHSMVGEHRIMRFLIDNIGTTSAGSIDTEYIEPVPNPITISVSPGTLTFDPSGGTKSVVVTAAGGWNTGTIEDWITCPTSGSGSGTISVTVDQYSGELNRLSFIPLSTTNRTAKIYIEQSGSGIPPVQADLSISPSSLSFTNKASTKTASITFSGNYVTVTKTSASWLTASTSYLSSSPHTYSVSVDAWILGPGETSRTATITFKQYDGDKLIETKTLDIIQTRPAPPPPE